MNQENKTFLAWVEKLKAQHPAHGEYLKPLGKTPEDLANQLGVSKDCVEQILFHGKLMNDPMVLLLSKAFGNTPQFWLNLRNTFDIKETEQALGEMFMKQFKPLETKLEEKDFDI